MNAFAKRLATQLAPALPRWLWLRAMAGLSCRPRSTLYLSFIIAAGTPAAAHYCSIQYHCASSPYSGTEHRWGISVTQDSRDSDFDSDCHSNMVAVGQMSVPSHASAHRVDSLQAMLDCSASLPSASAETGCLASHSAMLYCYASLPFSASAELGRLASSCSACSFRGFNTMCSSERQGSSSAFSRGGNRDAGMWLQAHFRPLQPPQCFQTKLLPTRSWTTRIKYSEPPGISIITSRRFTASDIRNLDTFILLRKRGIR